MEQKQERNLQQVQEKVMGFVLRTCMTQAMYWGKPNWVENLGHKMKLPEMDVAELMAGAYGIAAEREEMIHGNYKRAEELRGKALQILLPYDLDLQ